jgi:hypothetical protein
VDINELIARESIRATLATYTLAGDRLRADELAATFTKDGILESEYAPEADAFRFEGRDQIKGWLSRWSKAPEAATRTHQATFVRHHLATSQIVLSTSDTASARTYWTAYTDIGPDHCGYYLDSLRKVGDEWLIAHRRVRLDWRSPDSLFVSAVLNSR